MQKFSKTVLLIFLFSISAISHEFWIEASSFKIKVGQLINLSFFAGENFRGEPTDFSKFQVQGLWHFNKGFRTNLYRGNLNETTINQFLKFDDEGTHLVALSNSNKFIALDANKFNEYLLEDGMEDIYNYRKQNNLLDSSSREFYQRCAKTLIQVGDKTTDTFKRNSGMKLEIIPKNNPYTTSNNEHISFKILFNNKPLRNKLIMVWHKKQNDKTEILRLKSNQLGEVDFILENKGSWMVSTVQMINIKSKIAQYQSYWGSFTFGFD